MKHILLSEWSCAWMAWDFCTLQTLHHWIRLKCGCSTLRLALLAALLHEWPACHPTGWSLVNESKNSKRDKCAKEAKEELKRG